MANKHKNVPESLGKRDVTRHTRVVKIRTIPQTRVGKDREQQLYNQPGECKLAELIGIIYKFKEHTCILLSPSNSPTRQISRARICTCVQKTHTRMFMRIIHNAFIWNQPEFFSEHSNVSKLCSINRIKLKQNGWTLHTVTWVTVTVIVSGERDQTERIWTKSTKFRKPPQTKLRHLLYTSIIKP